MTRRDRQRRLRVLLQPDARHLHGDLGEGRLRRQGSATRRRPGRATVSANQNASVSDSYDLAATIPVSFLGTDGAAATWQTFTMASGNSVTRHRSRRRPRRTTVGKLYPFSPATRSTPATARQRALQYVAGYYGRGRRLVGGRRARRTTAAGKTRTCGRSPCRWSRSRARPRATATSSTPDNSAAKMPGCSERRMHAHGRGRRVGDQHHVPYGLLQPVRPGHGSSRQRPTARRQKHRHAPGRRPGRRPRRRGRPPRPLRHVGPRPTRRRLPMRRLRGDQAGFSLIELLAAMVVGASCSPPR